jgi:hypothetical protein
LIRTDRNREEFKKRGEVVVAKPLEEELNPPDIF